MSRKGRRPRRGGKRAPQFELGDPEHPLQAFREVIDDWDAFVEASTRPEPTVIRTNTLRLSRDDLKARLAALGFETREREGMPAFLEVTGEGPGAISDSLEHWNGLFYMQQASTGVAAPLLDPRPGDRVLDLCAAPGGKTTHLAEAMEGKGTVVCADVNENRIRALLGNIYRLGHSNILVLAADARQFPTGPVFDRVMVDVPCSAQGTLRKRKGQIPHQSKGFAKQIAKAQRKILKRAIELTRPGGTLLYVTCTFDPAENEAVLSRVLAKAPVEVDRIELDLPHARGVTRFGEKEYDPRLDGAIRLYPHHLDSGGLFICRLVKTGTPEEIERAEAARAARGDGSTGLDDEGGSPGTDGDGWRRVPSVFPGEDFGAAEVAGNVDGAEFVLEEHMGIETDALPHRWMRRGTNLWAHTLPEWPVEAWEEGRWRVVALGFRGIDVSGAVPRPSNDLITRWGHRISERVVDLEASVWHDLLAGRRVNSDEFEGRIVLSFEDEPIARGFIRDGELRHEVPKGRLRWLRASISQRLGILEDEGTDDTDHTDDDRSAEAGEED